jgi:hypothetical protein
MATEEKLEKDVTKGNNWNHRFDRDNIDEIRDLVVGMVEKVGTALGILEKAVA